MRFVFQVGSTSFRTPIQNQMFSVYALYTRTFDKIYIGYSSDLEQRLLSHNYLSNRGWTTNYRPWELIYSEEFETKKEAIQRERELKSSRGRIFIRSLIK